MRRTTRALLRSPMLLSFVLAACATDATAPRASVVSADPAPALAAPAAPGETAPSAQAKTAPSPRAAKAPVAAPKSKAVEPIDQLLALSVSDNRVQEHLRHLTKEIGPRLTGSKRFDRAAEWCKAELASWGLDARLEKWGEFDVAFDRGRSVGRIVSPVQEDLVFITSAWSPGTSGPVRGPAVLEPTDEAELETLKPKLAGAWVVRRSTRPDAKLRRAIDEALDSAGAAGTIAGGGDELVMSGNHRVKLDELPKRARVTLRRDQYKALVARLEKSEAVELEFDVENTFAAGPVPCFNVVADVKGLEHPDEFVIVGGHLDSWDGAEGAQDNGTGVATTMEAARLIAACGAKPRRTIRFVLFGGEEEGLFGSQGYVKTHADELDRTSVVLVHDGGGTALRGIQPDYRMLDDFEAVFAPLARVESKFPFAVHEVDAIQNSGDSDHAPFISKGVPAFFWEQSEEGYEHVHHTQYDVFESVDPEQQAHSARVVAVAALGFANLDHLVDRANVGEGRSGGRRRLGVMLEGMRITSLTRDGKAQEAGLREGDEIASVDGVAIASQSELSSELQKAGPAKRVAVKRGGETIEVTLDYTGAPGEAERVERAKKRAEWLEQHPRKTKR